jgi:hypothetical protein
MPAVDAYANQSPALSTDPTDAAAVTPSDGTDLTFVSKKLFVGGAGNLVVITAAGNTVTFTGVAAGTILPIRVSRVKATGTTATNIVAMY